MTEEMAQSPLKVSAVTKERVRIGSAVDGITQGEFVGKAVDEFIERHQAELKAGFKSAGKTLGIKITTED